MKDSFSVKSIVLTLLQWLGATVGFIVSLVLSSFVLPLPEAVMAATPPTGILTVGPAMLVNGAVNAAILVWAAKRSSLRGLRMWLQLLVLSFGAQTLETQIESGYFLSAFPLLQGTFGVYLLMARGLLTSVLITLLVVLLVGGLSPRPRPQSRFRVELDRAFRMATWLGAAYLVLYMIFGYYVAWHSEELRLFYSGSAQLKPFLAQWGSSLMEKPELPVFQYFRGILWLLCLVPLFRAFSGRRVELVVLSFLALGLLPTVGLTFPNPLMPAGVSLAHFWEVSISTGIFGALCAWFVPSKVAG